MKNISPTGLGVLSERLPTTGEKIHLLFQTDDDQWIEIRGAVRWQKPGIREWGGGPGFGLEFTGAYACHLEFYHAVVSADE